MMLQLSHDPLKAWLVLINDKLSVIAYGNWRNSHLYLIDFDHFDKDKDLMGFMFCRGKNKKKNTNETTEKSIYNWYENVPFVI